MEIKAFIIKQVLEALRDAFASWWSKDSESEVQINLTRHLAKVDNWSLTEQFYGRPTALATEVVTVALRLSPRPRQFGSPASSGPDLEELELLGYSTHYLVLGDPGAGKTTLLKRLSRHLLLQEPRSHEHVSYPILIRLREIGGATLVTELADILGLSYEQTNVERSIPRVSPDGAEYSETYKVTIYRLAGQPLEQSIASILDSTQALILLDGLDEVHLDRKETLEQEIVTLAGQLQRSKIIVSCRSGDYFRDFQGFSVVEVCALRAHEIRSICASWLGDPGGFLQELKGSDFQELASRPLFLAQLLVLYESNGYLPKQPSDVYSAIVTLLLEEWDRRRRVKRKSRYAGFQPQQKFRFLCALAFHLTYLQRIAAFSARDLELAYAKIRESFDLPSAEASLVARELESHTGIIVKSGFGQFEFVHYSLQEYLCGHYLVREPFGQQHIDFLEERPGPLAIAVTLASNPSNWFSALIVANREFSTVGESAMASFIRRILAERPFFSKSRNLGLAILRILFASLIEKEIGELLRLEPVAPSLALALGGFTFEDQEPAGEKIWIEASEDLSLPYSDSMPRGGVIPRWCKDFLEARGLVRVETVVGARSSRFVAIPQGSSPA